MTSCARCGDAIETVGEIHTTRAVEDWLHEADPVPLFHAACCPDPSHWRGHPASERYRMLRPHPRETTT